MPSAPRLGSPPSQDHKYSHHLRPAQSLAGMQVPQIAQSTASLLFSPRGGLASGVGWRGFMPATKIPEVR
eukprot:11734334-Karenia_brevis.AAC.1